MQRKDQHLGIIDDYQPGPFMDQMSSLTPSSPTLPWAISFEDREDSMGSLFHQNHHDNTGMITRETLQSPYDTICDGGENSTDTLVRKSPPNLQYIYSASPPAADSKALRTRPSTQNGVNAGLIPSTSTNETDC